MWPSRGSWGCSRQENSRSQARWASCWGAWARSCPPCCLKRSSRVGRTDRASEAKDRKKQVNKLTANPPAIQEVPWASNRYEPSSKPEESWHDLSERHKVERHKINTWVQMHSPLLSFASHCQKLGPNLIGALSRLNPLTSSRLH